MKFKYLLLLAVAAGGLSACSSSDEQAVVTGDGAQVSQVGPIPGTAGDFVQNVGDSIFYGLNKHDLTTESQMTLTRQSTWLKMYPSVTVTVEGHCDERGTREYNMALGERRAFTAKNFIVTLGVDANRVATVSYGKERPFVIGHNEAAWAQNRRARTVIN